MGERFVFCISGYLLANVSGTFCKWYGKRVKRIIPTFVIISLIDFVVYQRWGEFMELSLGQTITYYFLKYWFVTAILIYYVVYFFIFKSKTNPLVYLLTWGVGYMFIYFALMDKSVFFVEPEGFAPFKVYYYFGCLVAGGVLKRNRDTICGQLNKNQKWRWCVFFLCVVSLLVWGVEYTAIFVLGRALPLQFLIQVGTFVFATNAIVYSWGIQWPDSRAVRLISESTLEIYLVQITFLGVAVGIGIERFPLNWLALFTIAFGGGIVFHIIYGIIEQKSKKIMKCKIMREK